VHIIGRLLPALFLAPFAWPQDNAAAAAPATPTAAISQVHKRQVDAGNLYYRVYAVVPSTGTGKKGDFIRPMFAPLPSQMSHDHTGILGYQIMQRTDDGKNFLVEFVAADRASLQPILKGAIVAFEKGATPHPAIEASFQKYQKSFSFSNHVPVRVP
jgi:hypothetical protein